MQIIPVIDVMNGVAVHAIGGHRDYYRPVQSTVSESSDPVRILSVLKRRYKVEQCYVADINGLQRREAGRCQLAELSRVGVSLMVDVGVRELADVESLVELDVDHVILGSETVPGLDVLKALVERYGSDQLIFSVDVREGRLITANAEWQNTPPLDLALEVAEAGITQFILLDLSSVGTGRGVSTVGLCRDLRRRLPAARLIAGGGVRSVQHLSELEQAGADGALVATALHNGTLKAEDLRRFAAGPVAAGPASSGH